jgi:hypothetical protein
MIIPEREFIKKRESRLPRLIIFYAFILISPSFRYQIFGLALKSLYNVDILTHESGVHEMEENKKNIFVDMQIGKMNYWAESNFGFEFIALRKLLIFPC